MCSEWSGGENEFMPIASIDQKQLLADSPESLRTMGMGIGISNLFAEFGGIFSSARKQRVPPNAI